MENEKNVDLEKVNSDSTSEVEVEKSSQQETTKTYSEEELNQRLEEQRNKINQDNQVAWNRRWGQEKSRMEKDFEKESELTDLLMKQTKAETIDDLLNMSYKQYGIEKPKDKRSKEDDEVLGKNDAKSILELDDDYIQEEAERLSYLKRNAREEATFMELSRYLTAKKEEAKRKKEIEENGIDEDLVNSEEFKKFSNKFAKETSLKEIVEIYSATNDKKEKKEKPFSAGSLKSKEKTADTIKDYYTYEESLQYSRKDFKENPELYKAIKNSMRKWRKKIKKKKEKDNYVSKIFPKRNLGT